MEGDLARTGNVRSVKRRGSAPPRLGQGPAFARELHAISWLPKDWAWFPLRAVGGTTLLRTSDTENPHGAKHANYTGIRAHSKGLDVVHVCVHVNMDASQPVESMSQAYVLKHIQHIQKGK